MNRWQITAKKGPQMHWIKSSYLILSVLCLLQKNHVLISLESSSSELQQKKITFKIILPEFF